MKEHDEERLTDPYGHLEWCVGSEDDLWCFDYHYDVEEGTVLLHAVVNSETGTFIMNAEEPVLLSGAEAIDYAVHLCDEALEWCADNDLEHDTEGWNQDPYYFARCLAADLLERDRPKRIEEVENWLP